MMSFIIYSRADSCPHKPCTRMTPVFSVTVRVVAGLLLDHPPAAPCEKSRTRFPRRAHLLSLCPGTSTELHSATRNGTPPPKCWALGPSSGHRQLASHALSCWLISASMCVSRHACGHSEVLPPPAPQWLWPSSARVWPARFVWAASFSGRVCCTPRGAAVPRDGGGAGPAEGARVPAVEGVLAWRREHGFPQGAPGLVPVSVASPNSCSRATGSRPRPWPLMARASLSGWCWWGPPVSRRLVTGGRAHLQPMC